MICITYWNNAASAATSYNYTITTDITNVYGEKMYRIKNKIINNEEMMTHLFCHFTN